MKFKCVTYVVLSLFLIICLSGFLPVKHSVKIHNLNQKDCYLIVKLQKSTISQWSAIGDNEAIYKNPKDVRLIGNEPLGYDYNIEFGENTFICYGEYSGSLDLYGEKCDIFDVKSWEILYPVKRNSYLDMFLPNSYLCKFDFR